MSSGRKTGRRSPPRRRSASGLAPWVAAAGLLLGCGPQAAVPAPESPGEAPAEPSVTVEDHVLLRVGYGPDAWSAARIEALGPEAYIEEQLHPQTIDDPAGQALAARRPALDLGFHALVEGYPLGGGDEAVPLLQMIEMKLLRAVHSRRQLEQVLADFWFDHFNVYGVDGISLLAVVPFERDAIRPHVLGRFEDMLRAVARSPAMLNYLDNWRSSREGFEYGGEVRGLNENYARELLELHTVGVDGGYAQADVVEVARAFTGWTIGPPGIADADGFFFWGAAHDPGHKSIMGGLEIAAGGGRSDGEAVIAFLSRHARTAEHVCRKLVVRFVAETPPADPVAACTEAWRRTGGDLRAVTRAVLLSPAFLAARGGGSGAADAAVEPAKVKRPLHFVASLARATDMQVDDVPLPGSDFTLLDALVHFLDLMGEPLYRAAAPTGFPDESAYWASGGGLITRLRLVEGLAGADVLLGIDWGTSGGTNDEIVEAVAERLLAAPPSPSTREALLAHLLPYRGMPASVRIREAGALLLSSPDFMQH